jgi:outer membrane receptor protein involved in Fe transport
MHTLLAFAALLPLAASAADAPASPKETDTAETNSQVQDIVVTATREPISVTVAPASISRIDGHDFASVASKHQADLLNRAAGVYVQRGSGAESLTAIRSPVLTGAGACGSFLVAEDSLPIRPVGFCNLNEMFELNYEQADTVEILRGPGSALFGASAVHGIVNSITPSAKYLPELFLGAEGGANSYKRISFGTAHGFGREADPAVAAYGVATRAPGWRDSSGVDELKLNLLTDVGVGGGELRLRAAGTVLNQETAGFIQGYNSYRDEELAESNPNPEAFRDASSARVSAHFQKPAVFGEESRLELAGIYRRSRMDFSQHFLIGKPLEHNAQTSYMVTGAAFLSRGDLSMRFALDAETARTELTEYQPGVATDGAPAANAIRPAGYHYDYSVDSDTVGGTASVDYRFSDRLRASAALRADTTNYEYDNHMLAGNTDQDGVACAPAGCLYSRPDDRSDRFDNVSPRITLAWSNVNHNLYFNASTGYRPPEMTELYRLQRQQTVADLDSEHLDSLEVGWKYRPFGPWSISAAVFAMKKTDVILRESNGFNVGSGSTRHRGFEYEMSYSSTFALPFELKLAGTVARHEYAFARAIEGGETIVDGNDIDTAPRNVHSLDLRLPFGEPQSWEAGLSVAYVGSYFLDAANGAKYPGHQVANLRLTWASPTLLRLTLRIDNLFDTAYADRADFAFGNYRYFPARGRAAFLALDYSTN